MGFEEWYSQFVDEEGNPDPDYEDHESHMEIAWEAAWEVGYKDGFYDASQPADSADKLTSSEEYWREYRAHRQSHPGTGRR